MYCQLFLLVLFTHFTIYYRVDANGNSGGTLGVVEGKLLPCVDWRAVNHLHIVGLETPSPCNQDFAYFLPPLNMSLST